MLGSVNCLENTLWYTCKYIITISLKSDFSESLPICFPNLIQIVARRCNFNVWKSNKNYVVTSNYTESRNDTIYAENERKVMRFKIHAHGILLRNFGLCNNLLWVKSELSTYFVCLKWKEHMYFESYSAVKHFCNDLLELLQLKDERNEINEKILHEYFVVSLTFYV